MARTGQITLGGRTFQIAPLTVGLTWEIDDAVAEQPEGRRSTYYLVRLIHAAVQRAMGDAAPSLMEIADMAELHELKDAHDAIWKLSGARAPSGETPSS